MNIIELHKFCHMERMHDNALPPERACVSESDADLCDAFAREWVRDGGNVKLFLDSLKEIRESLWWGFGTKNLPSWSLVDNIRQCELINNGAMWFDHCADELLSWIGVYA